MIIRSLFATLAAATVAIAAVNEPCYGSGGRAGVCMTTSKCSADGGTTINGACPSDPDNVKCCTKASCNSGGNCRWKSDCAGTAASGFCPGPSQFKCCSSSATGFGGYSAPRIPSVGSCKKVAVDGAKKIVAAWPGRVREIGCVRDCSCSSGNSDHCCGKATDMMCSDGGGVPTVSGKQIAEWVMNNRGALNLKYVIWGQRIWDARSDSVKGWDKWKKMEDRGDVTANHWDHVHVSYK
ncbi:D-alanyl-D-alanine carboxypeptidase [Rhypophila decipiens]